MKTPGLSSRQRRGRWFHVYRARGKEYPLREVHGLPPHDPRVIAAYQAMRERYGQGREAEPAPMEGTWGFVLTAYLASEHFRTSLRESTQKDRRRILRAYMTTDADRPLSETTREDVEAGLAALSPHAARNHLKALRHAFRWAKLAGLGKVTFLDGVEVARLPKSDGFPTADAGDIEAFQKRWPAGTRERLMFDLAIYTGSARADLRRLGPANVQGDLLVYRRQKTGTEAVVPITPELRAVIARAMGSREVVALAKEPPFILTQEGKAFTQAGLGNAFGDAAHAAGWSAGKRVHACRKAFCVYWAEKGVGAPGIAGMAGQSDIKEVERYIKAADRRRMAALLVAT